MYYAVLGHRMQIIFTENCGHGANSRPPNILCSSQAQVLHKLSTGESTAKAAVGTPVATRICALATF
jgi:hypothetical protein